MNIDEYAKKVNNIYALHQWEMKHINPCFSGVIALMKQFQTYTDYTKHNLNILDIGMNIGSVSKLLLLSELKINKIVGFEPVKTYYDYAKFNLSFASDKMIYEPFALGDVARQDTIGVDPKNLGWNTICEDWKKGFKNTETINIKKFDDIIGNYPSFEKEIHLIKIDTEGFEYNILMGMLNTIKNLKIKPIMIIECSKINTNPKRDDLFQEFINMGYRLPKNIDWGVGTFDLIISPEDKNHYQL